MTAPRKTPQSPQIRKSDPHAALGVRDVARAVAAAEGTGAAAHEKLFWPPAALEARFQVAAVAPAGERT
jgi:hypothetical protein